MSTFAPWVWACSLTHAAVQTCLALPFSLMYLSENASDEPEYYTFCIRLFMIYIASDSLLHWRKLLPSMRMHHALTLSAASYNYFVSDARAPAMVLLANETSTVFYCAVKLLPSSGSPARRVCKTLFGATFFATRIVMNTMLMLKEDAPLSTVERCTLAALLALNTFWFAKGVTSTPQG